MPIISNFYGISIYINFNDHNPPHMHVNYGEFRALIDISKGSIMGGKLPPKARALTEEWRLLHIQELLLCWETIREKGTYLKIKGLE
jgi:hypothetical protein